MEGPFRTLCGTQFRRPVRSRKSLRCPGSLSLLEAELSCHIANSVRLWVIEGHLRVAASGGECLLALLFWESQVTLAHPVT